MDSTLDTMKQSPIWLALDTLAASNGSGGTPSYKQIIAHLGGGSNSTIKPIRDAWQRERQRAGAGCPPVPDTLQAALAEVWLKAHVEADQQVLTVQAKTDEAVRTLKERHVREVTELRQQHHSMLRRHDVVISQLDGVRQQLQQLQKVHRTYQTEKDAEIERLQQTMQQQADLIEQLTRQNNEQMQLLLDQQQARLQAEKRATVAQLKLEQVSRDGSDSDEQSTLNLSNDARFSD